MRQQINLYSKLEIREEIKFTTEMMSWLISIFFLLLFINFSLNWWDKHSAVKQTEEANANLTQIQQQVVTLIGRYPSINPQDLDKSIKDLKAKVVSNENLINTLSYNAVFSGYMRGLAEVDLTGIWITEFIFNSLGQRVILKGNAVQATDVELYLEKLAQQPEFAGIAFELQNMQQIVINNQTVNNFVIVSHEKTIS